MHIFAPAPGSVWSHACMAKYQTWQTNDCNSNQSRPVSVLIIRLASCNKAKFPPISQLTDVNSSCFYLVWTKPVRWSLMIRFYFGFHSDMCALSWIAKFLKAFSCLTRPGQRARHLLSCSLALRLTSPRHVASSLCLRSRGFHDE